jgi:hypothetical protein
VLSCDPTVSMKLTGKVHKALQTGLAARGMAPRKMCCASRSHPSRFISSKQCPAPPGVASYKMHHSPVTD